MKTVFSGIQATGNLHLGNYLGSIANWIGLQNEYRCIFGVMNLHAITIPQDPKKLEQHTIDCAIAYLASGLDPEKSIIFAQSDIHQHTELAWILGCSTPLGWLNRMIQFKEKSVDNENLGLYAYPALMAADILLYKADLVPVGEDQKQHLELTRDIAGAFNRQYKNEYFKLPEPMIGKENKRIMSLQDGTKKMSKSDESDLSRINLTDDADLIYKKIKKCKTDSEPLISYDEGRSEIYNLLNIFSAISNKTPLEIATYYHDSGFGKFKEELAQALITKLQPIQKNITHLKNDCTHVKKILKNGADKAREIAATNMAEIKKIVGITI